MLRRWVPRAALVVGAIVAGGGVGFCDVCMPTPVVLEGGRWIAEHASFVVWSMLVLEFMVLLVEAVGFRVLGVPLRKTLATVLTANAVSFVLGSVGLLAVLTVAAFFWLDEVVLIHIAPVMAVVVTVAIEVPIVLCLNQEFRSRAALVATAVGLNVATNAGLSLVLHGLTDQVI